ncbi:MAG: hypothetical protein WCO52_00315 [bacterium]
MPTSFSHRALDLKPDRPLVFTALSKHLFYYRMFISKFVLEQGGMPMNPFMLFDYFMLDTLDRDIVRQANNTAVSRSDELWVFGPVSDGVLAEVKQAKAIKKPVRYFSVNHNTGIKECQPAEVEMEDEVAEFRDQL